VFTIGTNHPFLKELFDQPQPNDPALWAVLIGNHAGEARVDEVQNPTQCVLRTEAALTYFSPQTEQSTLERSIEDFLNIGPVWLVWPQNTSLTPPTIGSVEVLPRYEFYDYDPESDDLREMRKKLPPELRIKKIDGRLLELCEWKSEMEFYCGGVDGFLKYGLGYCLLSGEQIITEAYVSAFGRNRADIGAITRKPYRGRGYAPITCAYLIEACEKRGYQAYWSCERDHHASVQVARKLGFQHMLPYKIYEYSPP
jgi:RimJ/RimL family protein N-acetyltransferase